MLVDASHPEETRVAVVRGNRIEEFDFESQEKKQLRGNIYLAKVTRVEPSLQAAFIDYGGNRHGFLAFSEIHPDYYQIPVADRQALLEAEAAEARASREAEDAEDDANEADTATKAERPKRKSQRRSSRKAASEDASVTEEENTDSTEVTTEEVDEITEPVADQEESVSEETASLEAAENAEPEEKEKAKPKRRTTRRKTKTAKEKEAEKADAAAEDDDPGSDVSAKEDSEPSDDGEPEEPTTMAAMVETDSISEPLPGEEGDDEASDDGAEEEVAATEPETEEKPKKRRAARTRRKKSEPEVEESTTEQPVAAGSEEAAAESPVEEVAAEEVSDDSVAASEEEEKEKPAKTRRRSRRKKTAPAASDETEEAVTSTTAENTSEDSDDTESGEDENIESVGQEQDDAFEEASSPRRARRQYKIQEVIKRRQILLVQVVKEERGNKGAALTTYLSLAGRYSVLIPNTARGGGISRKITNAADRKRLKAIASELDIPEGMGVILRTAGASRTKVEITRDFQYLMRLWEQVRNLTLSSSAPCLVYEEGSLIKRSIRDLYDKDTGEILVSGERGYEEARDFMGMLMPNRVKKVKLYRDSQAIFAKYGVETQLENMVTPQVTLKSGGYLVMNQTEALVAVDVNSGRATREHSIENTALQTNLEAAEEVARQLRLRDLAGLIVIDFIDMEERRNNRAVEKKLKDCLKNDRARIQVGRISHFGLLEMSRQRIRASVLESTMDVCPHCAGVGYVRSESAIALHVFRALEEHVSRNKKWDANVRTTPDIAVHILNHKRAALLELEQEFGVRIVVLGDSAMHGQQFELEKGDRARITSEHAAIGYDGDTAGDEAEATDSEDTENENRGRKRGRRRGRRDRNEDLDAASNETQEAESDELPEDPDGDDAPRKKRRRGNRGGRRRKSAASEQNSETDETTETEKNGSEGNATKSEPASDSDPVTAETENPAPASEAEESKPARRSTRRKKAPVGAPNKESEVATEAVVADSVAEPIPTSNEAAKPKRRTTRRKAAAEVVPEADSDADITDAVATTHTPAESAANESEEKPKRSGWWSRGGGFF